jgi:hypothetical protein
LTPTRRTDETAAGDERRRSKLRGRHRPRGASRRSRSTTTSTSSTPSSPPHDYFGTGPGDAAIGRGRASRDVRPAGGARVTTSRQVDDAGDAVLIANAPDAYRFTMEHSTHYHHWARRFRRRGRGISRPSNHVDHATARVVSSGRASSDEDIRCLHATTADDRHDLHDDASTCGRSYEEGIAVFRLCGRSGRGRERLRGDACTDDALRTHYGVTVRKLEVHAYAEADHGEQDGAGPLRGGRRHATPCRSVARRRPERRCSPPECRVRAMNRWLE